MQGDAPAPADQLDAGQFDANDGAGLRRRQLGSHLTDLIDLSRIFADQGRPNAVADGQGQFRTGVRRFGSG